MFDSERCLPHAVVYTSCSGRRARVPRHEARGSRGSQGAGPGERRTVPGGGERRPPAERAPTGRSGRWGSPGTSCPSSRPWY